MTPTLPSASTSPTQPAAHGPQSIRTTSRSVTFTRPSPVRSPGQVSTQVSASWLPPSSSQSP
ncbi:MAG: hypothetical protein ACYTAQ_01575, partial [Planctomycetota bacterium]